MKNPTSENLKSGSKKTRCAIYTRVSTDQGLDQEFNSLDAQREAAEAYIKSQAHEGWTCLKELYDDGGFSGGSMERPALHKLLDDVRARKIDVIVVYKVDRLTRSLADFAKLVELFDAHDVSFVSVTQSFNTTSSMGRLTLNVLLSFAQFEREVTGERIRDKVAASRKKGMWMGGAVPLGYKLVSKKLVPEPKEAETVRLIFSLYLELKSLPKLVAALAEKGIVSRQRQYEDGRVIGGQPYRTGALSHLLSNRIYLGEVRHHRMHYTGEHEAIVDQEMFEAVQTNLAVQLNRHNRATCKSEALLQGLIYDDKGNRMVPSHVTKRGVRYRYYQSLVLNHGQRQKAGAVSRVPAHQIEQIIITALHKNFAATAPVSCDDRALIEAVVQRVEILAELIHVTVVPSHAYPCVTEPQTLSIPWVKQSATRKREVVFSEQTTEGRPIRAESRSRILKGVAMGRVWLDMLRSGNATTIEALATKYDVSIRTVRDTLSLAFLAPDIVQAAIDGRLPRGLGVSQMTNLPYTWSEQRRQLNLR
jgi:site-specific DNA recombinase